MGHSVAKLGSIHFSNLKEQEINIFKRLIDNGD